MSDRSCLHAVSGKRGGCQVQHPSNGGGIYYKSELMVIRCGTESPRFRIISPRYRHRAVAIIIVGGCVSHLSPSLVSIYR